MTQPKKPQPEQTKNANRKQPPPPPKKHGERPPDHTEPVAAPERGDGGEIGVGGERGGGEGRSGT